MHSVTIKYFKTLELIHFQIKIPKGGQAKAKEGRMLPPRPPHKRNPGVISCMFVCVCVLVSIIDSDCVVYYVPVKSKVLVLLEYLSKKIVL